MIKKIVRNIKKNKIYSIMLNRFYAFLKLYDKNITLYPDLLDDFVWNKILVLTPHADDETLGCGGLLIKAIRKNKTVKIVLFSDNSDSLPDENKDTVIEIRLNEFKKAMEVIGIQNYVNLNLSQKDFFLSENVILNLDKIINDFKPEVILIPSFLDNHEQHRLLNLIFYDVCKTIYFSPDILMYEVWSPLIPNLVVDISDVVEKKIEAIKCYESQLKYINYLDTIIGLNSYRSITNLHGKGYCEGYLLLKFDDYIKLGNKVFEK